MAKKPSRKHSTPHHKPSTGATQRVEPGSEAAPVVRRSASRSTGALLIVTGLLLNPWSIRAVLVGDEMGVVGWLSWTVAGLGMLFLALGVAVIAGKIPLSRTASRASSLAAALVCLLALYPNLVWLGVAEEIGTQDVESAAARILESEHLHLDASIELRRLTKSALNLHLPDHNGRRFFSPEFSLSGLGDENSQPRDQVPSLGIEIRDWSVDGRMAPAKAADFILWKPYLDRLDYFDHAKFYIDDAHFSNKAQTRWSTKMGFHGLAKTKVGEWSAVRAKMNVEWFKDDPEAEGIAGWRIHSWELVSFETSETAFLPFEDVLEKALLDPTDRQRARTSLHEIVVARFLLDSQLPPEKRTFRMPHRYFRPPAQDRHPGLAVVDIDRDGLDDLYVMARWGPNMLFRNRGDGTFENVAGRVGLDTKDFSTSALFADFDNDGDDDLFLGRSLARSQYFVNENGRFVESSQDRIDTALPYLVSAVTAADYNGDGLLDIYVSTYASDAMRTDLLELRGTPMARSTSGEVVRSSRVKEHGPLADFLSDSDAQQLYLLRTSPEYGYHGYRNAYGPPNMLLKNLGNGRFAEDTAVSAMRVFRHTYQGTWSDYDGDGDPDIYLANDFSPNNMIRNNGDGTFTDVTEETGTADIGFGMGVSWGDYDRDGLQDLYISNMFSKAGRRIMKQVPNVNPIFKAMARGNSLFRNTGDRFEKVSGLGAGTVNVEVAGWSWGSQFVDLDNDGWLDVYALSGHYTAPKAVENQVDI